MFKRFLKNELGEDYEIIIRYDAKTNSIVVTLRTVKVGMLDDVEEVTSKISLDVLRSEFEGFIRFDQLLTYTLQQMMSEMKGENDA